MINLSNNLIYAFLIVLSLGILLNYLLIKKYKVLNLSILFDTDFKKPQSFHEEKTLRVGGISFYIIFLIIIFFITQKIFYDLIFLASACFFIGLIDDLKFSNSPKLRLILLFFFIYIIIIFFEIETPQFQIFNLDRIISESWWLRVFLLSICFLIIINGSNFIDGYNGLLVGQFSIILILLNFINYYYFNYEIFFLGVLLLSLSIATLFFNFPKAKLFLGDSGSYLLGGILSYLLIKTSISTKSYLPPFFFACITFYIFFEVVFSFLRKLLFERCNPLYPDKKHLHMLLFVFFKKKNNLVNANYKTSICINSIYILFLLPLILFYNNLFLLKLYFFFLLFIYSILYFFLYFKIFKK